MTVGRLRAAMFGFSAFGLMSLITDFIHGIAYTDLPAPVRAMARRCLLDLCGCAIAGAVTPNASIMLKHAVEHSGPGRWGARLLMDGRRTSVPAAAMAGAAMIDAYDAHDGHKLTKGHAGVVIFPTLLAIEDELAPSTDGAAFLTRFVIGVEVALRAGIALHRTACDYHTSGAWNALGAAALTARATGLTAEQTRHALGSAEYYGPRSQMMRCIDFPTMLKDGATYGAHVGVTSALIAADGFTGAPALTVESADVADLWRDLGSNWRSLEQYMKPWPVCRWAQPAVEAVQSLLRLAPGQVVTGIHVRTFAAAARLDVRAPASSEEAQYALPFPVAAMAVTGKLDQHTITHGLGDPAIIAMARGMRVEVDDAMEQAFPGRRFADVTLTFGDGRTMSSGPTEAHGDPETALDDKAVAAKFEAVAGQVLCGERLAGMKAAISTLGPGEPVRPLLDHVLTSTGRH